MNDDVRGEAPLSDEERARLALEQLKQVHAADLASEMMISLVSFAYQKLGLTEHTAPVRDLGDAHLAIELLRALLETTEREGGVPAGRELRATLAQLQLGFAQVVQLSGAPAEEAAPAEAEAPAEAAAPAEAEAKPATTRPAETKPAAKRPAVKKPAAKKRTAKQPAAKKPAANKRTSKKPAAGNPAAKRTAIGESAATKPRRKPAGTS